VTELGPISNDSRGPQGQLGKPTHERSAAFTRRPWAAVRARQADEVHGVNKRGITPVPDTWTAGAPMIGPEYFLRAEQLAEEAHKHLGHGEGQATAAVWAAVAQVHATLAVAAAIEAGSARRDRPELPTPEIGPLLPGPLPPGTGPLPLTSSPGPSPQPRAAPSGQLVSEPASSRGRCDHCWTRRRVATASGGKAQPGIGDGPGRVPASLAGKPSRMDRSPNRSRCLTQAPARTTDSAPDHAAVAHDRARLDDAALVRDDQMPDRALTPAAGAPHRRTAPRPAHRPGTGLARQGAG
jgi:hypothetical protein